MDDASGRYSNGWYWGNYYWTGSQNLCDHIAPKNIHEEVLEIKEKAHTYCINKHFRLSIIEQNVPQLPMKVQVKQLVIGQDHWFIRPFHHFPSLFLYYAFTLIQSLLMR